MKNNLQFNSIIKETLARFSNYAHTDHYKNNDPELQFSFFFGFSSYIIDIINSAAIPESNPEVIQAFELFNEMLDSKDDKVINLAVVGVIENLVQEKKSKYTALKLLNGTGKKYLVEVLEYTGVKD